MLREVRVAASSGRARSAAGDASPSLDGRRDRPRPSLEPQLLDALSQTTLTVAAILTSVGAEHDLSLTQVRMLGILLDRTARMAELADHLGLERSTLSGLVDRAEKRGLVVRTRSSEDRRALDVALTDEGRLLARRGEAEIGRALAPLTARLTADERASLTTLLERMLRPDAREKDAY